MRVAVLGAGSIGTVAGAYLAAAGQDVELIARNPAQVQAFNEGGARITGTTEFQADVHAVTPDGMSGIYDVVLLLTKQLQNAETLRNLLPYLGPTSVVCSLQNGIPEEDIAAIVGRDRVVAGSVEFGATQSGLGVSSLTTEVTQMKKYAFQIGELSGERTERIGEIKAILDFIGGTHISENLIGTKWSKLLVNNAFSGLSAALGGTYGDVLDNEISVQSAAYIADETIKVARARGVKFAPMGGFDVTMLEISSPADVPARVQAFRAILAPHRLLKASMLQDLEKKRPTEVDYINGTVVRLAVGTPISTPFNTMVVKLVKQAEETGTVPDFNTNVRYFESLLSNR